MLPREWRKCTLSAELILNPMTGVIIEIIKNLTLKCIKTAVFWYQKSQKSLPCEGGQPLSHTHTPLGQLAPSLSYLPLFSNSFLSQSLNNTVWSALIIIGKPVVIIIITILFTDIDTHTILVTHRDRHSDWPAVSRHRERCREGVQQCRLSLSFNAIPHVLCNDAYSIIL